jgi:hypothetical protein
MTEPNGIEAWREVHSKLLVACELAQEAVDVQLSQQRYWLEEIVGNVTEHGTLEITSHWAHPSAYRRTISKRKRNSLKKRRRTISEATFMRGKKRKFKLLKAVGRDSVSSSKGESESASVTSSHAEAPPRKLRIKMKRPSQPKPPPPPPPPPAPCQYEEPESADEEEEPEHHESTHNLAARDYVEAQQYVGQNPLQMMVRSMSLEVPKEMRHGILTVNLPCGSSFLGRRRLW